MAQPNNWEADKMLDVYIHDYLVKRNLKASAKAFQEEGKVSSEPVAIDAPGGFLFEWWSVFWDIFIARTNEKHSEVAASYIETQSLKARERYQQQQMSQQQQQQQMQMQQMLLRQQQQQQQQQQQRSRDGGPLLNGSPNGLMNNNSLIRQNQGTANAMAAKIYEECLKLPPKDSVDEAVKGFGDNVSQLLNQNNMLKNANSTGQPSGSVLHSTAGLSAGLQQVQIGSQQLPVATQDIKTEMNTVLGQSSGTSEGFLFGASGTAHSKPNLLSPGTSQEGSNPPLRGWPLTGIDPLRSSLLQPQKSFMQSSQQYNLQMLPPQQQQRLLMQAQANSNLNDVDSRRIQMLLNRNAIANKDGQPNAIGDVTQKVGSPLQSLSPMARPDMEMLLKMKMAQMQLLQQQQLQQQQQQRQQLQHEEGNNLQQQQQEALSNQHSQVTSHQQQQDDKVGVANGTDGSVSNSFRGNEQGTSKSQNGRKRKRPGSSSGPANSSGTANTAGPSLSSPPSTPSNQTSGDVMNMAGNLQHSGSSSNPLTMYASEGQGILASPSNPLADIDRFVDDGSLEDNVESFFVA